MTKAIAAIHKLLILTILCSPAFAAQIKPVKVAVIDVEKVFSELSFDRRIKSDLRKAIKEAKDDISDKIKDIEKINKKLEDEGNSEKRNLQLREQLDFLETELVELVKKHEELISREEDNISESIMRSIYQASAMVANNQGVDLIIERKKAGVIFAKINLDITDDVVKYLQKMIREGEMN